MDTKIIQKQKENRQTKSLPKMQKPVLGQRKNKMIVNKIKLPKQKIKKAITILCLWAGILLALGGYPPIGITLIIISVIAWVNL